MHEDQVPLISCVMPTYGRAALVNESVAMFLAQDYPAKELIVLNDCAGQTYHCDLPGVRVINTETRFPTLGEKRNASIELARGEIIAVWDDDDVYLPWRLSFSADEMRRRKTPFYRAAEFWAYWGEPALHENASLTLNWDRWPPEVLTWDERSGDYRDQSKPFFLRELDAEATGNGVPGE